MSNKKLDEKEFKAVTGGNNSGLASNPSLDEDALVARRAEIEKKRKEIEIKIITDDPNGPCKAWGLNEEPNTHCRYWGANEE